MSAPTWISFPKKRALVLDLGEPGAAELMDLLDKHKPLVKTFIYSLLISLYEDIKHGDEEHQKWLLDKINEFYSELL